MTPYHADPWLTVYAGDCREVLAELPSESVHCVVTSPPYWGLRDYGVAGQLGLEPTPEEYVANIVAVFREVRRVLRSDGTVWLNLGDSYYSQGGHTGQSATSQRQGRSNVEAQNHDNGRPGGKVKDLVGIPWRVAFALQADGWYLRSDIVWAKPNPMPESVTDRPTKAHEYLFLLSKAARYYYDADAVREPRLDSNGSRSDAIQRLGTTDGLPTSAAKLPDSPYHAHKGARRGLPGVGTTFVADASGRNLRSVWTIATEPYPGAHFATFPQKLVEPCIKAGTSERGVCPECGAPWVRETRTEFVKLADRRPTRKAAQDGADMADINSHNEMGYNRVETTGWRPSCHHDAEPVPATVLDPFAGSGTVGRVAQRLSRRAVLIDLNADYLLQTMGRNRDIPLGLVG